ncbi:DNA (cytosine-5-)-methyltransferase [Bradyrhizobium yuanmingense]|uniref:DNA cytosine methyltransferase n=1 Tax=Bradyrhizobium yuanmingense TaxID=108015 RepID=UPI0012FC0C01|nr:DNA (cytosine-5-)-methyltransferase [Bradyrhizobium yuanmingense]MVT52582.1 DNA (cytosine-5-)-methyltransferase [Bradyrhizobium yuanmingense]
MIATKQSRAPVHGMTVAGVFSGIGGFELGFEKEGFESRFLCELDADACAVLESQFGGIAIHKDVTTLRRLPRADVITAGFPCQDLSAVGTREGISGSKSNLIRVLLGLVEKSVSKPTWLVLENVPFMLQLERGRAMEEITSALEDLGYCWAYRVVDTRAFGLPQRRRRVILVACRGNAKPEDVLLCEDAVAPAPPNRKDLARGFYWTEGNRGIGWAIDAIPTLKGGSSISIPSPPAIWKPEDGSIRLPDIRDAERLQGFKANWTLATQALSPRHERRRWKQVGNAVSVPVAKWIAHRIANPGMFDPALASVHQPGGAWPLAAYGKKGARFSARVSEWPLNRATPHLHTFLKYAGMPISNRAATGFFERVRRSTLKLEDGFLEALALAAGLHPGRAIRIIPQSSNSTPSKRMRRPKLQS